MIKCNYGMFNNNTFYKYHSNYFFKYGEDKLREFFYNELYKTKEEYEKEIIKIKEKYTNLSPLMYNPGNCIYFKQAFVFDNLVYATGFYVSDDTLIFGCLDIKALMPIQFVSLYNGLPIHTETETKHLIYEPEILLTRFCNALELERNLNKIIIRKYQDETPIDLIELNSYNENDEFVSIIGDLSDLTQNNIDIINLILMELYNNQKCMFINIDDKWELTLV